MGPGHRPPRRVEPGGQLIVVIRPITVVLDVFPRGSDRTLHRTIHLLARF